MSKEHVVVWDPEGNFRDGEIIEATREPKLAAEGAVMLPIDSALLRRSGAGGWVKRSWGQGVVPVNNRRFCPIVINVPSSLQGELNWKARLIATGEIAPRGTLSLSCDSSQPGVSTAAGVSQTGGPVQLQKLITPQSRFYDGWIVGGQLRLSCAQGGFVGLSFYSVCSGVKILWLAVSQAKV